MQKTINIPHFPDLDFNLCEGGTFIMGDDNGKYDREKPAHQVNVPAFYMAKYTVKQRLYTAVMDKNPSGFKGDLRPVETVSWNEAKAFIKVLNDKTKQTFRLPSEAEWEFAAKGGIYGEGCEYAGADKLTQVGWYTENSENETKEVGLLLPNELGLYDMSGNVYEWCEDDGHGDYNGAPENAKPWVDTPDRASYRVIRGGSYFNHAVACRSAYRAWDTPVDRIDHLGFRLVLPAV